ncbi:MarR family winged helix-turn-helix transcriptional regulator [Pacificoceanicola onchidii]|uniref:MarR family winged helix-turn-helix transcriptional regulator n=1 Tax=Pacificoceanicola onchidii TaxID=2562685 RepID=UPI0010A4332E|nr:MarR family winged helix-turn-helix transcriptional regulator [Pacificoceanicola onchidii]
MAKSESAIDLGLHLPFQIAQLHSALSAQAKVIIAQYGDLNLAQWRIVRVVALDIAHSSTAVRTAAGLDKGQFSKMLAVLEAKGYVVVHPCPEDKRQHVLELTDRARRAHDRLGPVLDARQQHLVATLTTEEQEVVRKAIKAIAAAATKTDFDITPPEPEDT